MPDESRHPYNEMSPAQGPDIFREDRQLAGIINRYLTDQGRAPTTGAGGFNPFGGGGSVGPAQTIPGGYTPGTLSTPPLGVGAGGITGTTTTPLGGSMGFWGNVGTFARNNWQDLLGGALGAAQGYSNARSANQPSSYGSQTTQSPWGPTGGVLEEALGMARELYDRNSSYGGPPQASTAGIHGASPRLRELAQAMYDRQASSTFIPDAQQGLLDTIDRMQEPIDALGGVASGLGDFLQGPNPMMQAVFDRASSYQNPLLQGLVNQGMNGGMDSSRPALQGFLQDLLSGQQSLGQPGPMPGGPAPSPLPAPYTPMPVGSPSPAGPGFMPAGPGPPAAPMPTGPPMTPMPVGHPSPAGPPGGFSPVGQGPAPIPMPAQPPMPMRL